MDIRHKRLAETLRRFGILNDCRNLMTQKQLSDQSVSVFVTEQFLEKSDATRQHQEEFVRVVN